MTQSKPEEVTMRVKIKNLVEVLSEHSSEGRQFTENDSVDEFYEEWTNEFLALFQQQLEQERKKMDRTVRELETALEGVNHELVKNYEQQLEEKEKELIEITVNTFDEYFKGLGVIPIPQLTHEELTATLLENIGGRK